MRWSEYGECFGRLVGQLIVPFFYAASRLRRARAVHPSGLLFEAVVDPFPGLKGEESVWAKKLSGSALVRLSATLWKNHFHWSDGLGFSIRFGWGPGDGAILARESHQDLICATVRSPWTLPLAFFSTDQEDYLDNDYYAALPFKAEGLGPKRIEFRIISLRTSSRGTDRNQRIRQRVRDGGAVLILQYKNGRGLSSSWRALARIRLVEELLLDQKQLAFSPFNDALGLHPVGFMNAMRRPVYEASQRARQTEGTLGGARFLFLSGPR